MKRGVRSGRRVLVSVLDWGLGHATRTAAVVSRLVGRGDEVVLAGSGESLAFLRRSFPGLASESLPSFSPRLSGGSRQWLALSLQVPWFFLCIVRERWLTERLVRRKGVDVVLSDNRYGVRSSVVSSYVITHQLHPHVSAGCPRWVERVVSWVICRMLSRFDGCLVPDEGLGGLSGDLSSPVPRGVRAHAVGLLSRLSFCDESEGVGRVDWLGIASGAEPQRGLFVDGLISLFERKSATGARCVVVCGDGSRRDSRMPCGTEVVGIADGVFLRALIANASQIVCRSGYSTLMDLRYMGRVAFLVPTPGQAEQEYLAGRMERWGFTSVSQAEMQQI